MICGAHSPVEAARSPGHGPPWRQPACGEDARAPTAVAPAVVSAACMGSFIRTSDEI